MINGKIEEVRKSSGLQNPSKETFKKTSLAHLDIPIVMPSLTTSREISQYGAFKKSIASVSTNNHSIRLPARRKPIGLKKRLILQAPQNHGTSVPFILPSIEPISKSI
jgi:hypothetical protein